MNRCSVGLVVTAVVMVATGCAKSPERLVSEFMTAASLPERMGLVADPDAVRGAMERRYAHVTPPLDLVTVPLTLDGERPARVRATWKATDADGVTREQSAVYFVVRNGTEDKIDWAASIGLNEATLGRTTTEMPSGRFRYRGRLSAVDNQPAALKRADQLRRMIHGFLHPMRRRVQGTATAYTLEDSDKSQTWKRTVVVGQGSQLDAALAAAVAHGPVELTLDLRGDEGLLIAERLVSSTWVVPADAPPPSAAPSHLEVARPDPSFDAWVFSLDAHDVVRLQAAVIDSGDGMGLLVPCDGRSPLWSGYVLLAKGLAASGCAPRAVALRQVRALPPDGVAIAHVEVECLATGPAVSSAAPTTISLADAALDAGDEGAARHGKQQLMDVRARDIIADRAAFRGRTFSTSMCCDETRLAAYVAAGPFVELNRYVGQRHAMDCYLEWRSYTDDEGISPQADADSIVEVRVPADVAKQLVQPRASAPFADGAAYCKRQVSGAFTFSGEVSWLGRPVFYLRELHPARPLLPGSGSTWAPVD